MNTVLRNFYRCPEQFVSFDLTNLMSEDAGCFRFGDDVTRYGESAGRVRLSRAEGVLCDFLERTKLAGSIVQLPFDSSEVIENFRLERYAKRHRQDALGVWQRKLRDAYYFVRPHLPLKIRRQIQRAYCRSGRKLLFPRWPVDTTVEDLCEQLMVVSIETNGVKEVPFIWFWPDGAKSCVTLTHDVETEKGKHFCTELMRIDESFGMKAAIQVVPERRYRIPQSLVDEIRSRHFELNIQDLDHDGRLYRSRDQFLERAVRINEYGRFYGAKGFRSAVLYRNTDWYDALQFSFDMSVPNVAHLDPQRGGCCTVMPYFIGNILEIPVTTTQDYTLFHICDDYSLELWKTQIDLITRKNGVVSFIVHPDYVIENRARRVYEDLLSLLQQLGQNERLWFALPGEIDSWWRARSRMRVVNKNNTWQVLGDDAGRAKLAFARVIGGRLTYEIAAQQKSN